MQTLDRVYSNFANSLKSPQTRSKYEYNLKKFLISDKISINNFVSLPSKDIENMLIDYITKMKTDELSTSYINVTLAAIKHLCVMNDIVINSRIKTRQLIQPETGDIVHQKEILTMHDSKLYFLFLSGYPDEVAKPETTEIFDHIIKSLKWTSP